MRIIGASDEHMFSLRNKTKIIIVLVVKSAFTGGMNMALNEICSDVVVSYTTFGSNKVV